MDGSHPAVPLFGTVRLTDRGWQIECEAHVKVRLRRHFPRAPQVAGTTMVLSANPENSRDLLWFLQRFPMHVEHAGELERLAALHVDTERRVAEILEARRPPPAFALAEPARDYQSVAGSLVLARNATLLADDVGLGKSVSAICAMTDPGGLPAVVVVPPHLCLQWRAYIARFAPALTVHVIQPGPIYDLLPSKKSRRPGLRSDALPDVVIVSYFMLRKWADTLAEFVRYVVFDECQQLRNPNSQLYESCVALRRRAERCIGLSATPISNYGQEFFWVLDAIDPGCMGTRQEFLRDHCSTSIGTSNERLSDPEGFGAWLRREGLMLRRTRADVGRELPPLSRIVQDIPCDLGAIDAIKSDALDLAKIILAENETHKGARMQASAEFDLLLRQATGIGKAAHAADFVKLLCENGEKVAVFVWHREVIRILQERLAVFSPTLYTGSESNRQKQESARAFIEGESQVLLISLRSGAGLDGLQQVCRTVVFAELDWSPSTHLQCIGRAARDGQLDPVLAYFLVADAGADPYMTSILGLKVHQIDGVINPGGGLIERASGDGGHVRLLAQQFLERHAP